MGSTANKGAGDVSKSRGPVSANGGRSDPAHNGSLEANGAISPRALLDAKTLSAEPLAPVVTLLRNLPPIPAEDPDQVIQIEPTPEELQALERLLQRLPESYTADDRDLLLTAYAVASYAHRTQFRQSGEPYVTHPIAVATILAELHMDPDTVAAGLAARCGRRHAARR